MVFCCCVLVAFGELYSVGAFADWVDECFAVGALSVVAFDEALESFAVLISFFHLVPSSSSIRSKIGILCIVKRSRVPCLLLRWHRDSRLGVRHSSRICRLGPCCSFCYLLYVSVFSVGGCVKFVVSKHCHMQHVGHSLSYSMQRSPYSLSIQFSIAVLMMSSGMVSSLCMCMW